MYDEVVKNILQEENFNSETKTFVQIIYKKNN